MNSTNAAILPGIHAGSAKNGLSYNGLTKSLNNGLWAGQILLAAVFLLTGGMKVSGAMPAQAGMDPALVTFIGTMELLGAFGLLLPRLLKILPRLTAWAASGLATIMALATALHLSMGQFPQVGVTVLLGATAAFVAWGRFKYTPKRM